MSACGGVARSTPAPSTPGGEASATAEVSPPEPPRREGAIDRAALDQVLAGGLGRFLQSVSTEPHLEAGRFVGFRVTSLAAPYFEGVDLREGDTLVSVNGLPIERPEQALQAWEGLRVASELTLEVLRTGERRQLRFVIED